MCIKFFLTIKVAKCLIKNKHYVKDRNYRIGISYTRWVGIGVKESWESFIQGRNGANEMKSFDTSKYKVHRSCEVKDFQWDFELENQVKENTIHKYVYYAAREALQESGLLDDRKFNKERFGIAIGTLAAELTPFERLLRLDTSKKITGLIRLLQPYILPIRSQTFCPNILILKGQP